MPTPHRTDSPKCNRGMRLLAAGAVAAAVAVGMGSHAAGAIPCACTFNDTPITYARDVTDGGGVEVFKMASNGGGQTRLTNSPGFDGMPSWSPNRSRIVFASNRDSTAEALNFELYVMDANGANQRRLTNSPKTDFQPAWSPTSDKIAFTSTRDGNSEIYVVNADGSNLKRLTTTSNGEVEPAWSPDGQRIVFVSDRGGVGTRNLFIMNADGSGVRRLTNFAGADEAPSWSPDGSTIAFSRELSGNIEIHVVNTDGSSTVPTVVRRVTNRAGFDGNPSWSPDGRIAYASTNPAVPGSSDIRVIRPDGTGDSPLATNADWEGDPDWGRIPPPVASQ